MRSGPVSNSDLLIELKKITANTKCTSKKVTSNVTGFTNVGAGNYTVSLSDEVIFKTDITGGGDTVTLPESPVSGQTFTIKDVAGTAGTNNITIDTTGAPLIDGAATATISTNYGSITVVFNGTNYFTI